MCEARATLVSDVKLDDALCLRPDSHLTYLTVDPVRQMYAETWQNTAKSSSGLLGNAAASIEVGLLDAELCPASTP